MQISFILSHLLSLHYTLSQEILSDPSKSYKCMFLMNDRNNHEAHQVVAKMRFLVADECVWVVHALHE